MSKVADRKLAERVAGALTEQIRELEWASEGGYLTPMQEGILNAVASGLNDVVLTALTGLRVTQERKDTETIKSLRAENRTLKQRVAELEAIDKMLNEARAAA